MRLAWCALGGAAPSAVSRAQLAPAADATILPRPTGAASSLSSHRWRRGCCRCCPCSERVRHGRPRDRHWRGAAASPGRRRPPLSRRLGR